MVLPIPRRNAARGRKRAQRKRSSFELLLLGALLVIGCGVQIDWIAAWDAAGFTSVELVTMGSVAGVVIVIGALFQQAPHSIFGMALQTCWPSVGRIDCFCLGSLTATQSTTSL